MGEYFNNPLSSQVGFMTGAAHEEALRNESSEVLLKRWLAALAKQALVGQKA